MSKIPKLTIELIPATCQFSNARSTVKTKDWNKIRFLSYKNADNKCEICSETGKNQGFNHDVECHEVWEYNDVTHIQKLISLVSLCVLCHKTKHFGMARAMGYEKQCFDQLAKVNNWNQSQIDQHIFESFETQKERSQHEWVLDLSILNEEPYNLNIDITKKRVFEVKKYKKKRRKAKSKKKRTNKRPPKKKS